MEEKDIPEGIARCKHASVLHEDSLWVFGGLDLISKKPVNNLSSFSLANNKWTQNIAPQNAPTARSSHSAIVHKGNLIVYGGINERGDSLADIFQFNFAKGEWKEVKQKEHHPRQGHTAGLFNDSMLVYGGEGESDNAIHLFNLKSNKWSKIKGSANPEVPQKNHVAVVYSNHLFVYGGDAPNCSFWSFDLESKGWSKLTTGGVPPLLGPAAVVINGQLILHGGKSETAINGKSYSYDFIRGQWKSFSLETPGVYLHTATVFTNKLLLFGGLQKDDTPSKVLTIAPVENEKLDKLPITQSHMVQFPPHLLVSLFHFIKARDLVALMQSCKTFYSLINNNEFWHKIFSEQFDSYLRLYEDGTTHNYRQLFKEYYFRQKKLNKLKTMQYKEVVALDSSNLMCSGMEVPIVLVGDEGVGKSALVIQFIQNHFIDEYDPTIEDSYRKRYTFQDTSLLYDILDTANIPELVNMRASYVSRSWCIVFLFSLTSRESFLSIASHYKLYLEAKSNGPYRDNNKCEGLVSLLVGTKSDLEEERQVTAEEAQSLANEMFASYLETSAKLNQNVQELFQWSLKERLFYEVVNSTHPGSSKISKKNKKKMDKCNVM